MKRVFGILLVMALMVGCGNREDIEPYIVCNKNGAVTGFTGYSETYAVLELLTEMPELESPCLNFNANITDARLVHLKELPNLTRLNLGDNSPSALLTQSAVWSSVINHQPRVLKSPLVRTVDLDIGETVTAELSNGKSVTIRLLHLEEIRDPIRQAVRSAKVTIEVDSRTVTLESGMYNLPMRVGSVQIECPVTSGYNSNGTPAFWGLDKAARLRVWPAESPLTRPGTLIYPVEQRWFATRTWFDNEAVDGGSRILPKIYYHSGLDIGASEAQVKVIAATDALVVSVANRVLEGHRKDTPVAARYDVVYLLDQRGWYYRYSHLHKINDKLRPGRFIVKGADIGTVGKEGASGGWSHLHFEIKSRQPSGKWGTQAGNKLKEVQ